ncbi:MAG: hydroxymethylglutaryl-CoA lyase [Comamonas sp.]
MASDIDVHVCEVGLRDGLQSIATFFPTEEKLAWIRAEAAVGMPAIEVTSFVPPKLIPQFADSAETVQAALTIPNLEVVALVPNLKGAERGIELGVHTLNFAMSVSHTHNIKNVRRKREDSIAEFGRIVELVRSLPAERRPKLVAGMGTALGCSYEGRIAVSEVALVAEALAQAGADQIMVCDTVGYANPALVREVFKAVQSVVGGLPLGGHFHDTRGLGLANVTAALECGVRHFDASLGGLGGCQFAPGATGNIVMDDLCFLLDAMGLRTGVDLEHLVEVRQFIARNLPQTPLYGGLARSGLPTRYATADQRLAGATH